MNQIKSHPILATFFDFYFVSLALMTMLIITQALLGSIFLNYLMLVGIFIVLLITIVLYHAWFSGKVSFMSYGEMLAGKQLKNKEKIWTNPYKKNRFFLFLVVVVSFLMVGDTWNAVIFLILRPAFILGGVFKLTLVFLGAYLIGRGKILGAWVAMIPFLVATFFVFTLYRVSGADIYFNMMMSFLVVATGLFMCPLFYGKETHRKT